ncbi:DUF3828 domain-containing protein [Pseudoxanthomonas winnipegensis]|uniref:DUF3828 domain-containing protein n=1 Tax=Pseudoxanthomonas winnipegensis TaxID=2480810 RepID=UPI00102D56FF|nr:DUF3828 domain-containing protein [Pseudoxanthomonas winnipegensis]RZZ84139.1 DUF3828 domain-containing protein [Pseudoxanthomonas winnipegensis]
MTPTGRKSGLSGARLAVCIVASSLLMLVGATAVAATPDRQQRAVVERLYQDFAWEAVLESDTPGLAEQSKDVLRRYFTARLAGLIAEDAACAARRREICRLDFAPLWGSQDPSAEALTLTSADGDTVRVQYMVPSTREHIALSFRVAKSADGWRIDDILYPDGSSLAKLLSAPLD